MRYRERDERTEFNPESSFSSTANDSSPPDQSCVFSGPFTRHLTTPYLIGRKQETTDVVVPNFYKRRAKGEIFNNPYSSVSEFRSVSLSPYSFVKHYEPGYPAESRFCADGYASESGTDDVRGLNAAVTRANHLSLPSNTIGLEALITDAGTQASANVSNPIFAGATFLAEFRETMEFLENPLKAFTKLIKRLKSVHRRRKAAGDFMEFLSEVWLAGRYGLRPLVHDIVDAVLAISDKLDKRPKPKRFTARGSASMRTDNEASGIVGTYYRYSTVTDRLTSVRAGILYEISVDRSSFGLRLQDVPISLYEATRWSFIWDWFINLGPWIDAITPKVGVRQLAAWTSIRHESTTRREIWHSIVSAPWGGTVISDGRSVELLTSTIQERNPGINVGLTSRIQPLVGDIGKLRIADLIAIAVSTVGAAR